VVLNGAGQQWAPPPDVNIPTPPTSQTTSESKALGVLRKLLGEADTDWTCREQGGAVLTIIKMGARKTMIPVIPAMLEEDKVTVIVLPLKSLMDDYICKLGKWEVLYEFFDGSTSRLRVVANIILVSADIARMPNWKHTIGELHQRKLMVHLTFDEGQFTFDGEDFRKEALGNLYELCMFDCMQLVVMSAMISEASVPALKEAFGLTEDIIIFRTKTTRLEIRYAPRSKQDVTSRTIDLVHEHMATFAEWDRGLPFVTYLDDRETLKCLLVVNFYAGKGAKDPKAAKVSRPP
jgi:superfamily II DNA helicase RecQ